MTSDNLPPVPSRIAALPMYDLPELRAANDTLWQAVAAGLVDHGIEGVPLGLTRGGPLLTLWRDPRLLLAQSCGYPLETSLRDAVKVVAIPRYRAQDAKDRITEAPLSWPRPIQPHL